MYFSPYYSRKCLSSEALDNKKMLTEYLVGDLYLGVYPSVGRSLVNARRLIQSTPQLTASSSSHLPSNTILQRVDTSTRTITAQLSKLPSCRILEISEIGDFRSWKPRIPIFQIADSRPSIINFRLSDLQHPRINFFSISYSSHYQLAIGLDKKNDYKLHFFYKNVFNGHFHHHGISDF